MQREWKGRAIVVYGARPPAPTRELDYGAYLDDVEPPTGHALDEPQAPYRQGWGRTAELAVADLVAQLEEDEDFGGNAA